MRINPRVAVRDSLHACASGSQGMNDCRQAKNKLDTAAILDYQLSMGICRPLSDFWSPAKEEQVSGRTYIRKLAYINVCDHAREDQLRCTLAKYSFYGCILLLLDITHQESCKTFQLQRIRACWIAFVVRTPTLLTSFLNIAFSCTIKMSNRDFARMILIEVGDADILVMKLLIVRRASFWGVCQQLLD